MTCFAKSLKNAIICNQEHTRKLFRDIVIGIGLPLLISSIVAFFLMQMHITDGSWDVQKCLIFVNSIKIGSIITLAWHTSSAVAQIPSVDRSNQINYDNIKTYKHISTYMTVVATILTAHTAFLFVPLCSIPATPDGTNPLLPFAKLMCSWKITHLLAIVAFLYMPWFLFGNWRFQRNNQGIIEIERFTNAFIYGTNIPFIAAFFVIMFISIMVISVFPRWQLNLYVGHDESEVFFAGAMAFLIYSSTVASICIDHYARPFLNTNSNTCTGHGNSPSSA